ncbi:MAG: low molecular weight phosphotyrosine protein phosphatase [Actinobacteria bacterium]|nr:low molecular weight phosphotyrosine protein phosphatase [Actinomycetota bacterium]
MQLPPVDPRETGEVSETEPIRICFVCLGNICRSPTAEGIMRALVEQAGLSRQIHIDSAGTASWHRGEPPDARAVAEAARRGVELQSRASSFHRGDTHAYDLVLAMDHSNLADLHDLTPEPELRGRIMLLRSFDPALGADDPHDGAVPDPWAGGPDGFAEVYDLIEAACAGLLEHLRTDLRIELRTERD